MTKIISFLSGLFYYETFIYEVPESKDRLIGKIDGLLSEKRDLLSFPALTGHFADDDSFIMKNRHTKYPATLKGIVFDTINNKTKIEIAVRPHWVYLVFLIGVTFSFVYNLADAKTNSNPASRPLVYIIGFLALIIMSKANSNKLKKSFEKYLNISAFKE